MRFLNNRKLIIDIFQPPQFKSVKLNIEELNTFAGKCCYYASSGKATIFHILKALEINDKILLPAYVCNSVLIPLKRLRIKPIFYDIELADLNASIESIKSVLKKNRVDALLVASLYGNPSNLVEIERYCFEHSITLIDDAAQSFGAMLEGRKVGTFGNGGFFSFSPGKSTAGHMGAFFWVDNCDYYITRKHHCLAHYLKWLSFYFNRLRIYDSHLSVFKKPLFYATIAIDRLIDLYSDDICNFEKEILGGILNQVFSNELEFRKRYFCDFVKKFDNHDSFRIIKNIRGIAAPHKLVILLENKSLAEKMICYLKEKMIYSYNGYKCLTKDRSNTSNATLVEGRVVELPIEDDAAKMEYLFDTLSKF